MAVTIKVTGEQVRAAQIEVSAFRSAGLTPDPMVVRLARATVSGDREAAERQLLQR